MKLLEQIAGAPVAWVLTPELAIDFVEPDFVGPVAALAAGPSIAERAASLFGVSAADSENHVGDDRCEVIAPSAHREEECTP